MDISNFLSLPFLLAVVFAGSILILFVGLDFALTSRNATIETRLDQFTRRQVAVKGAAKPAQGGRFDYLVNEKRGSAIATELARADLRLNPGEWVAINIGVVAATALLGYLVGGFVIALLGGVGGFFLPRLYLRYLQGRRRRTFDGQLGDTIVLLANSLRSGYSLLQSMETAAKELPPPMSQELGRVTREVGLGLTVQEALANMYRRMPSDDLDLMITSINVQHEVGGNLAEILDTIAHTIRERIRIQREIRTITAQQRLSGIVLAALPLILGFVMYLLNPLYISHLWQETCGIIMMVTGGIMMVIGFLVIRQITKIEV